MVFFLEEITLQLRQLESFAKGSYKHSYVLSNHWYVNFLTTWVDHLFTLFFLKFRRGFAFFICLLRLKLRIIFLFLTFFFFFCFGRRAKFRNLSPQWINFNLSEIGQRLSKRSCIYLFKRIMDSQTGNKLFCLYYVNSCE